MTPNLKAMREAAEKATDATEYAPGNAEQREMQAQAMAEFYESFQPHDALTLLALVDKLEKALEPFGRIGTVLPFSHGAMADASGPRISVGGWDEVRGSERAEIGPNDFIFAAQALKELHQWES